jgi:muramoyltetrapeptide carboxypeptidase LdcA involved in peptidoglycan recycling
MKKGMEYTTEYLKKCLFQSQPFSISPSPKWSDDPWYHDQENRTFIPNEGYLIINEGQATGTIIGGNMCTFNLLHGTEFMPSLNGAILFLEDDELAKDDTAADFDRNLQSILHQPGSNKIAAILIGRFQKASQMTSEKIKKIIQTKAELKHIPVIANVDFGHTTPAITFPIGGTAKLVVKKDKVVLETIEH